MPIFCYCQSYNTLLVARAEKLYTAHYDNLSARPGVYVIGPTIAKNKHSMLIFTFIVMPICIKYMRIVVLNPLYTLLVKDMKHT